MHPYEPRPIRFCGIRTHDGWQLKVYSIAYAGHTIDWSSFEAGIVLALRALPKSALAEGRPGVGFLIAHQGREALYTVLAWWERENELPLRVFVRRPEEDDGWRPARGDESICVWDLQVLWAEREAYVATALTPRGGGTAAYRRRHVAATWLIPSHP